MGLPCDCGCNVNSYNVRKMRISDGRTIWRRLVTYSEVTNEIQRLYQTGTRTGGTFKLTFMGQETAAIPDGSTAAAIATALGLLSTIGPGNITGSGGPIANSVFVYLTFVGDLAGIDVPLITVSDGASQYGSGEVQQGSTVVHARAHDCAYLHGGCGDAGRLVVGIQSSDGIIPFGLSTAVGTVMWRMPEDRLVNPELDSNAEGTWVGIFTRDDLPLVSVRDGNHRQLWSRPSTTPWGFTYAKVMFGEGTYLFFERRDDGFYWLTYGDAETGYVTYSLRAFDVGQTFLGIITNIFGINEEIAIVEYGEPGFNFEVFDIASRTQVNQPLSIFVTSINDADWQRRNGEIEIFLAGGDVNDVSLDVLTGAAHTGNGQGLYRVLWKAGDWPEVRWILPTETRPAKLWICSDGVVAVCGTESFSIDGRTCEIFKCDFDLNLIWVKRWRGVGAGYGIRGLSGDADHVYVSGDPGSWSSGDV